ncbi:hypothetical protein [Qipengyuania nanhaisediminis]|uniref:hypothetical protein n=1 Tax=Qipengyuania nanhaisediminis TaxID=604088 RepID=UPI0038B24823
MKDIFKPIVTTMSAASALSLALAACTTEPDEIAEAPVEESNIVDADAPAVGLPEAGQDATPPVARPTGMGDADQGELGSGAEPGTDIHDTDRAPAVRAGE